MKEVKIEVSNKEYKQLMKILDDGEYRSLREFGRAAVRKLLKRYGMWVEKHQSLYDIIAERNLQRIGHYFKKT